MFTGIIVATGQVALIEEKGGDMRVGVDAPTLDAARTGLGESVSVQGACLTVTAREGSVFYADVSRETMAKTTLGTLGCGSRVNLEPALRAGDALGGHMVSGHVDAVGRLTETSREGRSWRMQFELPAALMRFVAPKGSICINGVSLTVNQVGGRSFDVNIIPHTYEATTFSELVVDAGVNIEVDTIARYIDRLLTNSTAGGGK